MFSNKKYANDLIYNQLMKDEPCMIARFGSTEMKTLVNYVGVKEKNTSYSDYIKGKSEAWWWQDITLERICFFSGFFPKNKQLVEQFCDLMVSDMQHVDILASWLNDENIFSSKLLSAKRVMLEDMEPFFCENPWTKALEGKKVLVVHPFSETIEEQYKKRELLFENELLPNFELITLKAVQSIAGVNTEYKDWFEALEYMKSKIDEIDYDICIIGAGAYGFPLAAHVKRKGKKAIHFAGATQLLFGIKGKRWEEFVVWPYMNLFNEHWVRPGGAEKLKNGDKVEGACYW